MSAEYVEVLSHSLMKPATAEEVLQLEGAVRFRVPNALVRKGFDPSHKQAWVNEINLPLSPSCNIFVWQGRTTWNAQTSSESAEIKDLFEKFRPRDQTDLRQVVLGVLRFVDHFEYSEDLT